MNRIIVYMFYIWYITRCVVNSDDPQYEDFKTACDRCTCTPSGDAQTLTIDCQDQNMRHPFSNWPPHNKTLIASFADNNYTQLERFPPSDAEIELVLKNCQIKYIVSGVFAPIANLKFLDLSYNLLTQEELSADKLKGPVNNGTEYEPLALEHLNLAYNQLHSLVYNLFEHTPNLRYLNLEGNDFKVLDLHTQQAIASIKSLQYLNLGYNELTELVEDAIIGLEKLNELDLAGNQLNFVPGGLVHVGGSLEILNFSNNPIIELSDESFTGLSNLIDIAGNNLTELRHVKPNTFLPLHKLKKLSLCNNFLLSDIQREAFAPNQSLEEFYINNNRLEKIDSKLLNWDKLKIFEFSENPLDCTCDLYNITLALSKDITRNQNAALCHDSRKGDSVQVFSLDHSICGPKRYQIKGSRYITHHFTVLRISLVALSIVFLIGVIVAGSLGYTRFRRFHRNRNYPFASQVMYNPLSTVAPGRF